MTCKLTGMITSPKKIMVAGDWHGNTLWAMHAINYARANGVDVIVQLGDFGWWSPGPGRDQFLGMVQAELQHCGITLYWVDGNHEDHTEYLDLLNIPGASGSWCLEQYPRIVHLPRGFRWEWWGVTWMSLGGAHSVDRLSRVPGHSWWPGEWITDQQLEYAMRPGIVDVIVSHDCPWGVDIPGIGPASEGGFFPMGELVRAEEHRVRLRRVFEAKSPSLLFHGHYHRNYRTRHRFRGWNTIVHGLDCDKSLITPHTLGDNTFFLTRADFYREDFYRDKSLT